MSRSRRAIQAWAPVIVWMLLIFAGSTDALSSQRTSRFLAPLLRWLHPGISETALAQVQFVVRKGGHLTEYALLAILIRRALHLSQGPSSAWEKRKALLAFGLATLYALGDEFHQGFVATRYGSGWDVLIDAVGAALGLTAIWLWLAAQGRPRQSAPRPMVEDAPG